MPKRLPTLGRDRPHLYRSKAYGTWLVYQQGRPWGEGYCWRDAWANFQRINRTLTKATP